MKLYAFCHPDREPMDPTWSSDILTALENTPRSAQRAQKKVDLVVGDPDTRTRGDVSEPLRRFAMDCAAQVLYEWPYTKAVEDFINSDGHESHLAARRDATQFWFLHMFGGGRRVAAARAIVEATRAHHVPAGAAMRTLRFAKKAGMLESSARIHLLGVMEKNAVAGSGIEDDDPEPTPDTSIT